MYLTTKMFNKLSSSDLLYEIAATLLPTLAIGTPYQFI